VAPNGKEIDLGRAKLSTKFKVRLPVEHFWHFLPRARCFTLAHWHFATVCLSAARSQVFPRRQSPGGRVAVGRPKRSCRKWIGGRASGESARKRPNNKWQRR